MYAKLHPKKFALAATIVAGVAQIFVQIFIQALIRWRLKSFYGSQMPVHPAIPSLSWVHIITGLISFLIITFLLTYSCAWIYNKLLDRK